MAVFFEVFRVLRSSWLALGSKFIELLLRDITIIQINGF
jgi:hypothetical protein